MTQKTENKATPVFHVVLADPEVPYPEMTGDEPCRTTDPEEWFPEQGVNGLIAKRMCLSCPILAQCRSWALANPQLADFGIWGGTSRGERIAARRREARKALEAAA
ncbi:WhiB family transcriptional regulator [Streptomyces chartreusis]|uniref:WhiB family transcriptional regulator n=1 Tax=Streptomyces chartreusis TaxID=1969 RepID=UPI0036CDFDCA